MIETSSRMIVTLSRNRSSLLYETAIPGSEHRDVGRSVIVPADARSARLSEVLAGRHAQEPAALTAEVCLVVVPGLNGPPCRFKSPLGHDPYLYGRLGRGSPRLGRCGWWAGRSVVA
jgi:hypothetical protein